MAEYTDARLELLLSAAIDRSVPDLREAVRETPVVPLTAPDALVPVQAPRRSPALRRTIMSLAACLVLLLGLGSFAYLRPQSVIGIDVNPSIELTANYFDKVLSVRALNQDAVDVIGDMDLKYVDLDIAVNALVGSMALHGYFESGQDVAVLVSVTGGSESHNLTLQKKLAVDIEAAATTVGAKALVYTQNTDAPPEIPPAPTATPSPSATPPAAQSPAPAASPSPSPSPSPAPATPAPSAPVESSHAPSPSPSQSAKPSPSPSPAVPSRPATAQERAVQNGISYGKQVFIDKLLLLDPTLNEQELAAMPIGKIAALSKQRGLDISGIVDYDSDDSIKENIEDFIDDLDDPDDDDDDDDKDKDDRHKDDDDDDEDDD